MSICKIDTHAHILPRNWPDLAAKYDDRRFPSITHSVNADGTEQHRIYKDGKFFREIWKQFKKSFSMKTSASKD